MSPNIQALRIGAVLLAWASSVWADRSTNFVSTIARQEIQLDEMFGRMFGQSFNYDSGYMEDPVSFGLGIRLVANFNLGEYVFAYPLRFWTAYTPAGRNATNSVEIGLKTERGQGTFRMAAGSQLELTKGFRYLAAFDPNTSSFEWSPWYRVLNLGYERVLGNLV